MLQRELGRGREQRQRFAVVVLAAGPSFKGQLRQARQILGRSLIERAARVALASGASEVVVVAGERAAEIRRDLRGLPVRVVQNRVSAEGISNSIRAGVSCLRSVPDAVVIHLGNRPRVTAAHLRELGLRALKVGSAGIVASAYAGVVGAPCAFGRSHLPQLLALSGPAGAQQLLRDPSIEVEAIEFAAANLRLEVPRGFIRIPNPTSALRSAEPASIAPVRGPPATGGLAIQV